MYLGAYRWDVTLGTAYVERKLELQKALFTTIPVPYVPTYNSDSIHVNAGRCVRYLVLLESSYKATWNSKPSLPK